MKSSDLEKIAGILLDAAKHHLSDAKEFYPYGATIDSDHKVTITYAYFGDDKPESQTLIDGLNEAFINQAKTKKISAAGLCCDVLASLPGTQKTDAIRIDLESVDGESIMLLVPYSFDADGELQCKSHILEGKERIWFK